MRRIYITGIGILSRIGVGYPEHKRFLETYSSNLDGSILQTDEEKLQGCGGKIDFDPRKYIYNKKSIKFMNRQCMLGCSAGALAAEDAHLDPDICEKGSQETVLVFGASVCDSILPLYEAIKLSLGHDGSIDYARLATKGILNLPPLWILTSLPNTTAGQIAIQHRIKGVNFSLVNGPTSGLSAMGEAFRMLRAHRANRAFCGGSEGGLYPDVINRLAKEGIVDKSAEATDCYRVGARGGLLAEGAAVVTLETEEVLKHRKSFPHAKIVGYSNGYIPAFKEIDVEDISTFYVKCMRRALADAGLEKDVVSLVQGTGFGHEKIDKAEAMAVRILFGSQVAFTGSNGIFDFTLGASGAMSLVTAVTQMNSGSMVPIRNANELHLQNQIDYVTAATTVRSIDVALVNCFDYLGCMVSVVIEKSGA